MYFILVIALFGECRFDIKTSSRSNADLKDSLKKKLGVSKIFIQEDLPSKKTFIKIHNLGIKKSVLVDSNRRQINMEGISNIVALVYVDYENQKCKSDSVEVKVINDTSFTWTNSVDVLRRVLILDKISGDFFNKLGERNLETAYELLDNAIKDKVTLEKFKEQLYTFFPNDEIKDLQLISYYIRGDVVTINYNVVFSQNAFAFKTVYYLNGNGHIIGFGPAD